MTHRDGKRIGRVIGARLLGETQKRLDHASDLGLARATVTADRGLHLLRRVAGAWDTALSRSEHHRTTAMADGECCGHVLAEVELLQGDRVRLVLDEQPINLGVDVDQPPLLGRAGRGLDHAAIQRNEPPATTGDDAVAGAGQAGINAEDNHVQGFCAEVRTPAPTADYAGLR